MNGEMRLTKMYEDGSFGVSDNLPCGENSHDFKKLLIDRLGEYEERGELMGDKEVMNGTYDQLDLELKAKMLVEFRNITKELEKIRKVLDKKLFI